MTIAQLPLTRSPLSFMDLIFVGLMNKCNAPQRTISIYLAEYAWWLKPQQTSTN